MNPKIIAALLTGMVAGAAPSLLTSDKASLEFSRMGIQARALPDAGVMYQITSCATVRKAGQKYTEQVCTDKFSTDAGDFRSCIGNALQLASDKYEVDLRNRKP